MESKKINQLATSVAPQTSDLTIIGDPVTGVSKKITLLQIANLFATTGTVSSVAVTETGEALTITGSPITSTGTINIGFAGGANQYVRGDGALSDFPTSSGGGSSVSYYLNSSVSQGTIGGVAYRELSKEPIIGAGTDITISANGYVASYITDANDPSLLEVPGGNFNCEFYFSVNSNAHNPYVYAELYVYDGTTFTLLGSNQAIPEYLSNGTTLSAYYFAIPVATAALTITDRLAIRIYVNVDTKIVTLHTENGHLCQVVTTFSKGMVSLNNLTKQTQFLATGTSGTDFAIVSSNDTHTFNLPVASATNTGKLSSTDWTTFNNKQNALTNPITGTGTRSINYLPVFSGSSTTIENSIIQQVSSNIGIGMSPSFKLDVNGTARVSGVLTLSSTISNGTYTYTLPSATGTLALTSQLTGGTVTSVGLSSATSGVTIGSSPITTSGTITLAIATASGSLNGLLSSTDWTTFNSKQGTITLTTTGTSGAATFSSNTLNIPNYGSALSAYLPLTGGTLTGALSGTSATFSGNLEAGKLGGAVTVGDLFVDSANSSVYVGRQSSTSGDNSKFYVRNRVSTLTALSVDPGGNGAVDVVGTFSTTRGTNLATATGNVGIGTSSPDRALTVNGQIGLNNDLVSTKGEQVFKIGYEAYTSTGGVNLFTEEVPLVLGTSSTERMRITSAGNVGIGISSPATKLDVNGTTKSTNYTTINNQATIPASSTATILTLSSSVVGVYIVQANFGAQENAVYGSTLIVVANAGSFRVVTNGSGANAALTLSGANVQIANALGSALDATASAILIAN